MFDFFTRKANQMALATGINIAGLALNTLWALIGAGAAAVNVAGIVIGLAAFGLGSARAHFAPARPRLASVLHWAALGAAVAGVAAWVLSL